MYFEPRWVLSGSWTVTFRERLRGFTVLDPAGGSRNFLYLSGG